MKKIALFDPYLLKFTEPMIKWWTDLGYEVRYERYYNPSLVEWADIVYFFTCDNNLRSATNPPDSPDFAGYDMHQMDLSNKKVIVQPIDIECWEGHHNASKWDIVDYVIFIADHIRELCPPDSLPGLTSKTNLHTIPFSVDLDQWTFKEREPGFDIAVVSERWVSKGTDLILQIAYKLKQIDERYKIHWLGQLSPHWPWEHAYMNEFIAKHELNIEITNILNDGRTVNEFLEDKNFLLHGSKKEGFSAATAEAAAKGLKPIINNFYGCEPLWGDSGWVWDSIDQAIEMILSQDYDSKSYRDYIINKGYTTDVMMSRIMSAIGEQA